MDCIVLHHAWEATEPGPAPHSALRSAVRRWLSWVTLMLALLGGAVSASTFNAQSPLGVNLGGLDRWDTDWPFIDEMKRAEVLTQNNATWNTFEHAKVDWDENGWPRSLTPKAGQVASYTRISYLLFKASSYANWDQPNPPVGEMHVFYEGQGTLTYSGGIQKTGSCGTNCDVIQVQPDALPLISITATTPGNHLRNIQVIWPGGICDGDIFTWHRSPATCSGTYQSFDSLRNAMIFHPSFLDDLKHFRSLRFMNWQFTNHLTSQPASTQAQLLALPARQWVDRPKQSDAQWNLYDKGGAPVEVMVALSNTLDAEPWFNMHVLNSDDYVQQFAAYVRDQLSAGRKVYVEFGNEIWNGSFRTGDWVEAKGRQFWPADSDYYKVRMNWFAKRTTEICNIWKTTWGAEAHRVQCVMGTQAANTWVTENYVLQCPLWRTDARNTEHYGQTCASQVDALAIAPYFGYYIGLPANLSTLITWSQQADGGMTSLFSELNSGGMISGSPAGGAIANARDMMLAQQAIAQNHGLDLLAYEGGQHLVGDSGAENNDSVTSLFRQANRDHRMLAAYTRHLNDWKNAGGKLMAIYHSVGPSNKWGHWGIREYQNQVTPPKRQAVLNFIASNFCWWNGCSNGIGPSYPDTDSDGIKDFVDNCMSVANADQRDTDRDGYGNRCDGDFNNDRTVNFADLAALKARFFTSDPAFDLSGDGTVNFLDLALLKAMFFTSPGPSGLLP